MSLRSLPPGTPRRFIRPSRMSRIRMRVVKFLLTECWHLPNIASKRSLDLQGAHSSLGGRVASRPLDRDQGMTGTAPGAAGGARSCVARPARCSRMRRIRRGWVMKETTAHQASAAGTDERIEVVDPSDELGPSAAQGGQSWVRWRRLPARSWREGLCALAAWPLAFALPRHVGVCGPARGPQSAVHRRSLRAPRRVRPVAGT
jgi:hypothetical protein